MRRTGSLVLCAAAAVVGCGSNTSAGTDPGSVVRSYRSAILNSDGTTACKLLSPSQRQSLAQKASQIGKTCQSLFASIHASTTEKQALQIKSLSSHQRGNTAVVTVVDGEGTTQYRLVESGGQWLISGFGSSASGPAGTSTSSTATTP